MIIYCMFETAFRGLQVYFVDFRFITNCSKLKLPPKNNVVLSRGVVCASWLLPGVFT